MAVLLPFESSLPTVAATAFLAQNATLIGRVVIAERASVFFGAVVRADRELISLGEGSNLQDNVSVHGDPDAAVRIGRNVSVGHGAVVHGCTIEDNCLIGMGATVLNHAVIGAGSLVAAGAVVLEGTVVPPGSLVAGVPAKVRRQLTEQERAELVQNAMNYVELSRVYLAAAEAASGTVSTSGE